MIGLILEGILGIILLLLLLGFSIGGLYVIGCILVYPLANLPSFPLDYKYGTFKWKGDRIGSDSSNTFPHFMYKHGKIAWMWIGVAGFIAAVLLALAAIGWIINVVGVDLL